MKSERPKVLAEVLTKPMLYWVIDAAEGFGFDNISVVTGFRADLTEESLAKRIRLLEDDSIVLAQISKIGKRRAEHRVC